MFPRARGSSHLTRSRSRAKKRWGDLMKSLHELCNPRSTVFDPQKRDTVLDLTDLVDDRIDAKEFFAENYITEGMKTLLVTRGSEVVSHLRNMSFDCVILDEAHRARRRNLGENRDDE